MRANDGDAEALTVRLISNVRFGRLELAPDGSFEFVPEPGFVGEDSFRYALMRGDVQVDVATVVLVVSAREAGASDLDLAASSSDLAIDLGGADLLAFAFEWLVPGVALAVPGLLLLVVFGAQGAAAAIWLPAIRRFRRGMTWRQR